MVVTTEMSVRKIQIIKLTQYLLEYKTVLYESALGHRKKQMAHHSLVITTCPLPLLKFSANNMLLPGVFTYIPGLCTPFSQEGYSVYILGGPLRG